MRQRTTGSDISSTVHINFKHKVDVEEVAAWTYKQTVVCGIDNEHIKVCTPAVPQTVATQEIGNGACIFYGTSKVSGPGERKAELWRGAKGINRRRASDLVMAEKFVHTTGVY